MFENYGELNVMKEKIDGNMSFKWGKIKYK